MTTNYKRLFLEAPSGWELKRNEFFDIDSLDNLPEDEKFLNIYCQEDMLHLQKENYTLDLGRYGLDNLLEQTTGYMLVLFRGQNWHNCELLELIRTKSKSQILRTISEIIELVNKEFYNDKTGYVINENNTQNQFIGQHTQFSVSRNVNELLE